MNNQLNKLNKEQLLNIISKMKKQDLIEIINNKTGGSNEKIISETKNAIRKEIHFDSLKINNNESSQNNVMANNNLYNKMYKVNNK